MYCFSQLRRLSSAAREVSLYALLEVAPSASASEIKRAFRQVRRRPVLLGCTHATAAAVLDSSAPAESEASSSRCQPDALRQHSLC